MKTADLKPWMPNTYISEVGPMADLTDPRVTNSLPFAQVKAAMYTTVIIGRMLKGTFAPR